MGITNPPLYTLDFETDPFVYSQIPAPFCGCIYDGAHKYYVWGSDAVAKTVGILDHLQPGIVFAHNGGRFDFFYLFKFADESRKIIIIKNRITQFNLTNGHQLRDSYKLFPFPLETYKKTKIDYELFRREVREKHKRKILDYLGDDCVNLYELVSAYIERFGLHLTIGGTAMKEMEKRYDLGAPISAAWDKHIRENYYFGGRVERYKTGIFKGDYQIIDINSAYPYVMRDYRHPIGMPHFNVRKDISENTFFVKIKGKNDGAFPMRTDNGLKFNEPYGTFFTTIHEYNAAVELGKFRCDSVLQTVDFDTSITFTEYIETFYNLRLDAAARGDLIHKLMFKFLLNNSYGRYAINPEKYKDYKLVNDGEILETCDCYKKKCACGKWRSIMLLPEVRLIMYERPSQSTRRMNIGTGASITGATRSLMMRGLSQVRGPLYCDTDGIICKEIGNLKLDGKKLGSFKHEGTGNQVAIAGRKMYAVFGECCPECGSTRYRPGVLDGELCDAKFHQTGCIKYASKGVNLEPSQIVYLANGGTIVYKQDAPVFRLNGAVDFVTREVRQT